MKILRLLTLIFGASFVFTVSCSPEDDQSLNTEVLQLPSTSYQYSMGTDVPTLGRVLFYDRNLSFNNSVSCSSCHKQSLAFADNVAFSEGFRNKLTGRNSMPIQNLNSGGFFPGDPGFFSTSLFWDGREHDLQSMVMKPIMNHVEMGFSDLDALAEKLETVSYYPALFEKAYGSTQIQPELIANALTSFLMSISAQNTKLDQVNMGNATLTALESKGRELFNTTYECNNCHQVDSPSGYVQAGTFANIGLEANYQDIGLAGVTNNPNDVGRFKIPSLRNVLLTAPYMHDGRFKTLEEVMGHYSGGVTENPGLDFRLRQQDGSPINRQIPNEDKRAIVAFLNTLTDYNMLTDVRFSNPFKSN